MSGAVIGGIAPALRGGTMWMLSRHGVKIARRVLASGVVLVLAVAPAIGCGGDGEGDDGGGSGQSGSAAAGAGGAGARAGAGAGAGTGAGDGAGAGARAGARAGAGGGAGGFTEMGVCGQRGEATVGANEFTGFEEYFLIGEEGFGEDICVVRFDVMRVGEAPGGCVDPGDDSAACMWTHLVEFSNPSVMIDEGGVCANSELGLDADGIAEIDGSQAAYGFVKEFAGHDSVAMRYDDASGTWKAFGNGTFDEDTGMFGFDYRDGFCDY